MAGRIIIKDFLDIEGLDIFVEPKDLVIYDLCVGWDTSGGVSDESLTGIQFIDVKTGTQIMEFNNKYNNKEVIEKVFLPLYKKIKNLKIVIINVERYHLGIDAILRVKDFYQQKAYELGILTIPRIYKDNKDKEGYWMSTATREYLISVVIGFLREYGIQNAISSKRFLKELFSLRNVDGKIKTSFRCDLVMAYGLALIARLYYIQKFLKYEEALILTEEEKEIIFPKESLPLPDVITIEEHLRPQKPYITATLFEDLEKLKKNFPLLERYLEKNRIFEILESSIPEIEI